MNIKKNEIMARLDIRSLYTNIPTTVRKTFLKIKIKFIPMN